MPVCKPASSHSRPSVPSRRVCRAAPLRHDEAGVSEVVGQILAFAIVAGVFVLSMIAFEKAAEGTKDRVIQLRADSTAARIASVVIEAGMLTETHGTGLRARLLVDLPQDLEGRAYRVALEAPGGGETARIVLTVPGRSITATAPLLAIEASGGVPICPTEVAGGRMFATFTEPALSPGNPCLSLEAAP